MSSYPSYTLVNTGNEPDLIASLLNGGLVIPLPDPVDRFDLEDVVVVCFFSKKFDDDVEVRCRVVGRSFKHASKLPDQVRLKALETERQRLRAW